MYNLSKNYLLILISVMFQISVVLPDTVFIPGYIENIFSENGHYYLVKNVTLLSLIDPGFITSFAKNGINIVLRIQFLAINCPVIIILV